MKDNRFYKKNLFCFVKVLTKFLGPLFDAVLFDYQRNVPQAREPEVLVAEPPVEEEPIEEDFELADYNDNYEAYEDEEMPSGEQLWEDDDQEIDRTPDWSDSDLVASTERNQIDDDSGEDGFDEAA